MKSLLIHDKETIFKTWRDFVALGPRFVGSDCEKHAAELIESRITDLGLDLQSQEFEQETFVYNTPPQLRLTSPEPMEIPCHIMLGSQPTGGSGINGILRYVGKQGVIGLLEWEKYVIEDELNKSKPIGYVLGRPHGKAMPQPLGKDSSRVPHFVIGGSDLALIQNYSETSKLVKCHGEFMASFLRTTCRNLIVHIPGSGTGSAIVLSAHYDSMYNTPGANDNAAGVIALLSIVEWLVKVPPSRDIIIAFFTAEEWDVAGSSYYVSRFGRERLQEQVRLVINLDGIAQGPRLQAWVSSESLETEIRGVLARTDLENPIFRVPAPPGSDHWPFAEIGIPVCMFTRGDEVHWHQPTDLPNREALGGITSIIKLIEFLLQVLP